MMMPQQRREAIAQARLQVLTENGQHHRTLLHLRRFQMSFVNCRPSVLKVAINPQAARINSRVFASTSKFLFRSFLTRLLRREH